jgi:hypothetical protein
MNEVINKINNKMSYKALEQGYQLYSGSRPYFYIDDEEVSRLALAQVLHLFYSSLQSILKFILKFITVYVTVYSHLTQ